VAAAAATTTSSGVTSSAPPAGPPPQPEEYRVSLVADLHRVRIRYPNYSELASLVAALRQRGAEFARLWDSSALGEHGNQRKTIDHSELGPGELDCDMVTVRGAELRRIIFTAEPGTTAAEQLQLLSVISSQRISAA
jgi:hypothetical protein